MARLNYQTETGPEAGFDIEPGRRYVLGRSRSADWAVLGEPRLSRSHAEARWEGGALRVRRLPGASNPIYSEGEPKEDFLLRPGCHFIIGKTRFKLVADTARPPKERPGILTEETLEARDLYSLGPSSDRLRLLDLLELPEILRGKEKKGVYAHIAEILRLATEAVWAGVIDQDGQVLGEDSAGDTRERPRFSRKILEKALADSPRPTHYSWTQAADFKATVVEGVDWAICAAARIAGEAPVFFYAAGSGRSEKAGTLEKARFVGLVADMVSRTMSNDRLQDWQGRLRHFFAGPVVEKILASDMNALAPRLATSTVLFFDIRGFSKRTEDKNEAVLAYVEELRRAMTAMTGTILNEHGAVLQYMGDGILACWNVPFDEPRHVDRACKAALAMERELGRVTEDWRCGIGMHTGEVVAGAFGSEQVFAYGVMGAVVNQASRIESLSKALGVPILVTREVAAEVSAEVGRCLRLGRFIPAGMDVALDLYALFAPGGSDPQDAVYAQGLAAFEKGEWEKAMGLLGGLPADYGPAQFLIAQAIENRAHAPVDWNGTIKMYQK